MASSPARQGGTKCYSSLVVLAANHWSGSQPFQETEAAILWHGWVYGTASNSDGLRRPLSYHRSFQQCWPSCIFVSASCLSDLVYSKTTIMCPLYDLYCTGYPVSFFIVAVHNFCYHNRRNGNDSCHSSLTVCIHFLDVKHYLLIQQDLS